VSKFNVGDRVVWSVPGDAPALATIAKVGTDDGYDYELVVDEEYISDQMRILYALGKAMYGHVITEGGYEDELEAYDE